MRSVPRITIIETGLVSPQFRERHGSYPQMFQRMVATADPSIACDVVSVASGEPLPDPATLDAILITGSAAGVYDDVAWIARSKPSCAPPMTSAFRWSASASAIS